MGFCHKLVRSVNLISRVPVLRRAMSAGLGVQPPERRQFFRRPLPATCIDFSSKEGKVIFSEALALGHMECYFKLAAQFRTQDQPAFCGLSTLVMVLNSLEVDPGVVWKGPWRWYHENMLDCCVQLQVVEQQGISFDQFECLALCNALKVSTTRLDADTQQRITVEDFRHIVSENTCQDQEFLVACYSRAILDQTGQGHFSPLAGYHPDRDLVLILDTARFKYPPHWISLPLLYKAMCEVDPDIGKARGFLQLSRRTSRNALLLFRVADSLSITSPQVLVPGVDDLMHAWQDWLVQPLGESSASQLVEQAVHKLVKMAGYLQPGTSLLTTQLELCCSKDLLCEMNCTVRKMMEGFEATPMFNYVGQALSSLEESERAELSKLYEVGDLNVLCRLKSPLTTQHFVAMLLLCWPYSCHTHKSSVEKALAQLTEDACAQSQLVRDEASLLHKQLSVIFKYYRNNSVCASCN